MDWCSQSPHIKPLTESNGPILKKYSAIMKHYSNTYHPVNEMLTTVKTGSIQCPTNYHE